MSTRKWLERWVLAFATLVPACHRGEPTSSQPTPPTAVPVRAVLVAKRGSPDLQRGLDQPVWHGAASTPAFVDPRRDHPVPHTEARASWDDRSLFLTLYIADDEFRSTDRVRVEFDAARSIEASPGRALRCHFAAESDCGALGVKAGFDLDGDVDANGEEDEEWNVTLAIPWATLAPNGRPTELPVALSRHDEIKGAPLELVWSRDGGLIRFE